MKKFTVVLLLAAVVLALNVGSTTSLAYGKEEADAEKSAKIQEEKDGIHKMVKNTLESLYKMQPSAEKAIAKSAGYAVFSNFGMKIFFVGGGSGKGIVFDKKNKKEVFMKMIEAQAGLGWGAKKFSLVFVFENQKDVDSFINSGWEFGGQASAAAKVQDQGGSFQGAISISPGVWLYQLTDAGLALELTGKGTKYYKDKNLN